MGKAFKCILQRPGFVAPIAPHGGKARSFKHKAGIKPQHLRAHSQGRWHIVHKKLRAMPRHAGQELHHQLEASSPHKNAGRLGSAAGIAPAGGGKRTIGKALHAQFHHTAACGAQPLQYWGIHPVRAG